MTLQLGNGAYTPPDGQSVEGLEMEWYRFKPSLAPDMKEAALIISHGGEANIMKYHIAGILYNRPMLLQAFLQYYHFYYTLYHH